MVDPQTRVVEARRPDDSVTIIREDGELDGDGVLPGFRLPVAQLFR